MADSGVNLQGVRQHNRALVLSLLLRAGPSFHADLAAGTGLSQQAVSKIVADLALEGLVSSERQEPSGVGKPRSRVRLRPEARCAFGAQLDRDGFLVVRMDFAGTVEDSIGGTLPTGHQPTEAVGALADAVRRLGDGIAPERVVGLGVGTVGPVDHRTGRVRHATGMPGWADVPLRDLLVDALGGRGADRTHAGMTVTVDKNTNTAALAHTWPATAEVTAVVLVGTGVGAGLVLDGEVYRGPRSGAGEFGHTVLDLDGPRCRCGRHGCLEELHRRATSVGERSRLLGTALADLVRVLDLERVIVFGRAIDRDAEAYRAGIVDAISAAGHDHVDVEVRTDAEDSIARGAALGLLADHIANDVSRERGPNG